ncbi:ArsC family reductase [Methylomonas paludis]|uniref:ArsC family reductase n=1 Tax=Methylomonas paludis TaxID=1173101 RepID=A0A975MR04_9GAMM|nr:ArsC family reductase [Methylomonas paludis]QWF72443.1 ArsC family reductase [Methylomonas paludis]
MWTVYGIKNCDSVKKARLWLESRQIPYRFHDYRVDGLDRAVLQDFIDRLGVDAVLNQRSTSWRELSAEQKSDLNQAKALELMLDMPTLIKRPILDTGNQLIAGFSADLYAVLS